MASLRSRLKFLNPARNRIELACDDLLQLSPALHSTFHSRHGRGTGVDAQTKVVIEGYQSAANSFAREAFRAVNPDVGIASHMHCVAPLVLARQRGIPALVLLREPVSSITSLIARFDRPDFSSELSRYTRFYRQFQRHRPGQAPAEGVLDLGQRERRRQVGDRRPDPVGHGLQQSPSKPHRSMALAPSMRRMSSSGRPPKMCCRSGGAPGAALQVRVVGAPHELRSMPISWRISAS
jgi:hypothetical protein